MTDHDKDDAALEALFASARGAETPEDGFLARLMDDADTAAKDHAQPVAVAPTGSRTRAGFWQRWLPVSGLTAATLAGVWIGVAVPESDLAAEYFFAFDSSDGETISFSPGFGVDAFLEGDG